LLEQSADDSSFGRVMGSRSRAAYPHDEVTIEQAAAALQGHNELLHTVVGQQLADLAHAPSYPDQVLVRVLIDKPTLHGCTGELAWAIHNAGRLTADQPPQP
jgi:hypothetical protein